MYLHISPWSALLYICIPQIIDASLPKVPMEITVKVYDNIIIIKGYVHVL
jgi:hypothetical protein